MLKKIGFEIQVMGYGLGGLYFMSRKMELQEPIYGIMADLANRVYSTLYARLLGDFQCRMLRFARQTTIADCKR